MLTIYRTLPTSGTATDSLCHIAKQLGLSAPPKGGQEPGAERTPLYHRPSGKKDGQGGESFARQDKGHEACLSQRAESGFNPKETSPKTSPKIFAVYAIFIPPAQQRSAKHNPQSFIALVQKDDPDQQIA
ncbi:hypothetical protein BC937DRAFT_89604 [Endogone sp. FLAS-F59071]|nr:hypothetical protein BC937DRAFT_89604 [Endogone sp. FLAS-F59071]|eukprot:RUS17693.1 hypothetical protein BC937DRAFT_89604 [Endogone sp. FLAS-F59071]